MRGYGQFCPVALGAEVRTFTRVYLGHVSIANALSEGSVTVAGRSDLRRAFSGWIGLSPFVTPRAVDAPAPKHCPL
jgi:hypothetical protein